MVNEPSVFEPLKFYRILFDRSSYFLGDMFVLEELTFTGSNAQKLYLKKCADFQITPCSHFVKSLSSKEIDMEHHNVGPKGAVACAFALTVRRCIRASIIKTI